MHHSRVLRRFLPSLLALGAVLAIGMHAAAAAPAIAAADARPALAAAARFQPVDYYWNRHHYKHRDRRNGRWYYHD